MGCIQPDVFINTPLPERECYLVNESEWLVPILLMHATAVELSSKRLTCFPAILCSKHFSAKKAAFSFASMGSHNPPELSPSHVHPQPERLALEVTLMCGSLATMSLFDIHEQHLALYSMPGVANQFLLISGLYYFC